MLVSIITPVYQGAAFLSATVAGVIAQTYANWELIIVDDGSTDGSFDLACHLAANDSRIHVYRKQNGGVADARNYGYARTDNNSEFVAFLDQDDIWHPPFLERQVQNLLSDQLAAASHVLARQIDLSGNSSGAPGGRVFHRNRMKVVNGAIVSCSTSEPTTFDVLICDNWIATPGLIVIRRSAFESSRSANGAYFDVNMGAADDWEMWIRLSLIGHFVFCDEVLMDWRIHAANNSGNIKAAHAAEFRVRKKMTSLPALTDEQRKQAVFRYRKACCSSHLIEVLYYGELAAGSAARGRFVNVVAAVQRLLPHLADYLSLRFSLNKSGELPLEPEPVEFHRQWPPR